METNAENLEKQLDLLENKGERTEKHDSLYAFLKTVGKNKTFSKKC